jgi:hypothetical protein
MTPARAPAQDIATGGRAGPWLMLMHQIPPKPDYLRVKIGRRLQQLGALPIKNSVYVLPNRPQCQEDFQWVAREITASGGQAWLTAAEFVDGLRDGDVRALFDTDRTAQYKAIGAQAKALRRGRRSRDEIPAGVDALRRRLEAVAAADFFGAKGRADAEAALAELSRARPARSRAPSAAGKYTGCTWVTRRDVHVDRIASAWLIRRFIDDHAHFMFVDASRTDTTPGHVRFDMFDAEFTHIGDACTFEVLRQRFAPRDKALVPLAEVVHDLDYKDEKFGRLEAGGVGRIIEGIVRAHPGDDARLIAGEAVFDLLYTGFSTVRRRG